jgi:DNA polymerase epsilon subunit 3
MGVPMNVDDVGVGGEVVDEEVMDEEVVDEEGEEGVHEGVVDDDGNDDWGQRELDRMVDEEEELLKDSRGLDDHSIVEDHVV